VINTEGLTFDPPWPPTLPPGSEIGSGVPGCHPCVFAREDNKEIEEYAFFGEISWKITDAFDINFGARYFDVKQTEAGRTVFQFAAFAPNPPSSATPDGATPWSYNKLNDNETPWKVALGWHPNEDVTVYALRADGYRLGGTNNRGIGAIYIPESFGGDKLVNYEAGVKSLWADRRVTLNASVFFMEWDNMQVAGRDLTGAFGFIGNAGKAEVNGIEVELGAAVTNNFDFTAQVTYLGKHELTEDQRSSEVIAPGLKGDKLPRIPEWTAAFTAQYSYQLPIEGWDGAFRLEGSYTDDSYTQFRPTAAEYRYQDSYSIFNARANFHNNPLDLDLTLFVENMFNEHGDVYIGGGSGGEPTSKVTNRPMTVGIQVTKGFGR
jgi:iron complex outermembrane receptor protein